MKENRANFVVVIAQSYFLVIFRLNWLNLNMYEFRPQLKYWQIQFPLGLLVEFSGIFSSSNFAPNIGPSPT
jgi:hypothetical protein